MLHAPLYPLCTHSLLMFSSALKRCVVQYIRLENLAKYLFENTRSIDQVKVFFILMYLLVNESSNDISITKFNFIFDLEYYCKGGMYNQLNFSFSYIPVSLEHRRRKLENKKYKWLNSLFCEW